MPRATTLIWVFGLMFLLSTCNADYFETSQEVAMDSIDLASIFDEVWLEEDLEMMRQMMDEYVNKFRAELSNSVMAAEYHRSKRATDQLSRVPMVSGMSRVPSKDLNASSSQNPGTISCFLWNSVRYCILGGTIYSVQRGKVEPFVSGLPVGPTDHVKAHVYDDVIFVAIYNKEIGLLHLYLLRSPGWTKLISVQHIAGELLEDVIFFENARNLYMVIAIQLGAKQYVSDAGMQCVIYKWLGTTMDAIHNLQAAELKRVVISPLDDDSMHLTLIYGDSTIRVWHFNKEEEVELIEVVEAEIPARIIQLEVFQMASRWCLLLGGAEASAIYCFQEQWLLRWQILFHNRTSSPFSWTLVQQEDVLDGYELVVFIFSAFKSQSQFQFYTSDVSGRLSLALETPDLQLEGSPTATVAFLDSPDSAHLYVRTASARGQDILEGFSVEISEQAIVNDALDPLLQCVADVEFLISELDPASIDRAEELKNDMVNSKDDFSTNATVVLTHISYNHAPDLGPIKVLYNFTEEFKRPPEIEMRMAKLKSDAQELAKDIPNLLNTKDSANFKGRLKFTGPVTADVVNVPAMTIDTLNNRSWNSFVSDTLRYSSDNLVIEHDIQIGNIKADEVIVNGTVGGTLPAKWLLKTGGILPGPVVFDQLEVAGDILVGDHLVNGVAMKDVLTNNETDLIVDGAKTFSEMHVLDDVIVDDVNQRDFGAWAEKLILQNSDFEQHVSGHVKLKGPVKVTDGLVSHSINGIDVSELAASIVKKDAEDQVVTGQVTFIHPLTVTDVTVETLNGVAIHELLSTSGRQTIKATVSVEVLDAISDVVCPNINNIDVDDFLYTDEEGQIVSGPVQFVKNVQIDRLEMNKGTLNGLDVIDMLNPVSLRIDSIVKLTGDLSATTAHVNTINGVELGKLRERYWTKSTNQTIPVNVRLPSEVLVGGNVTTKTFLKKRLDRDFYLTSSDEVVDFEINFKDVTVLGNVKIDKLTEINGVTLEALDQDVVKKDGDFTIVGTKTFQKVIVHGNLKVDKFNGLHIPDEIALLDRPQTLTRIFFDDATVDDNVVYAGGDLTVNTLNGLNLDDFFADAVVVDEDAIIDGNIDFQGHLGVTHLQVDGQLNGRNIEEIIRNGVRKSSQEFHKWSQLTVNGKLTFQDPVMANTLNGYDVEEYLGSVVNMSDVQVITGKKKVAGSIRVVQDVDIGTLNGIPLDFSTVMTISANQTITGEFQFDNLTAEWIDLRAINGRNLTDYIRTTGTEEVQIIQGRMNFERMAVKGAMNIESQMLNGCNLTQYLSVTEFNNFDSLVIENGSLILEQPYDNNPQLATLSIGALRNDRPQIVSGDVTFQSDTTVENLDIPHGRFGNIDVNDLLQNSMLKSVEQNVAGTIRYEKVEVGEVERTGLLEVVRWNDKNVQEMVNNVVLKSDMEQTIIANKTFLGDLVILGDLQVTGSIDDVPVKTLVTVNDTLPAGTRFTSLVIEKELNVSSGIIDGVNVTAMLQQRVPLRGNTTVKGNIIFNNVAAGDVRVKTINDLDLSDLVLKTASPGQNITGKKVLKGSLDIEGDITVSLLNGQNPEELAAFTVLKDQDTEFTKPLVFDGGLTVMKHVEIVRYNDNNMTDLMAVASAEVKSPTAKELALEEIEGLPMLLKLQESPAQLSDFEFFEQIQQVPFSFVHGSNLSVLVQHCPLPTRRQSNDSDTAAGALIVTHSTDGNSCKMKKFCRCHRSVSMPSDTKGHVNELPMPTRLKDYVESKTVFGDRVRLLHSEDHLFVAVIESLSGCMADKVSVAVIDPLTFRVLTESRFKFNDTTVDVALERSSDGKVLLAIGQKLSGVWIYSLEDESFNFFQLLETERVAAISMASHQGTLFLAAASYGLEAVSSVWMLNIEQGKKFELMKDVVTVGASDVIFTNSELGLYLTFGQDPSGIDPYSENWSQFRVPAQVQLYTAATRTFEMIQQLDIDRVISLTNLIINGQRFLAAATFTGKIRIYRLITGQGFQAVQTFKLPGVRSIAGYSISNKTYLAAASESRVGVFVARLRGCIKPTTKL